MVDRIEAFAAKLGDSSIDPRVKANVAVELRDNVEMLTAGALYPAFLKNLVPVFIKILEGNPAFASADPVQRLRNSILDTIHRLPLSPPDALKPYVSILIDALMQLVRTDNEDNVTLCMKIIMDLVRPQVDATANKVQPFLDLIQEMFDGMTQAVKDAFETSSQSTASGALAARSQLFSSPRPGSPASSSSLDLSIDQQTSKQLTPGMQSFKVIAECPILVVSLFQSHRNIVPTNVRKFVPLIKGALLAQAKPQQQAHEEAEKKGEIFAGVCREIKNRAVFGDFILAQVKTMSFLAYLLRQYSKQLDDFLPSLPTICIRMLRDCPGEKSATRKELIVAIRHIINFNFRGIFTPKVDDLLDERTLIGDGLTVYETMRPLAYSMVADLIHHVRDKLTPKQIQHTIELFSKNLLDDFPGTSFQTMSARLLLNMADSIANMENKQDARHFLVMILRAIAEKFALMNREYDNAVKLSKLHEKRASATVSAEEQQQEVLGPLDWDETDIFIATPIKTTIPRDPNVNPLDDNKFLFKNLMTGLKNLFFRLRATNPDSIRIDGSNAPANWNELSFGYTAEEIEVITKLFHEGARVFRYYSLELPMNETQYASPIEYWANFYMVQSSKEERDLLETFATVFHSVDPAAFYEVFQSQIPELFEMTFEHTALLHIPQFFLASEATSPNFCGMLLQFLMSKIEEVGSSEIKRSSILLRMFKLSFMAVTLFSQQNEQVLLPHVMNLLTKSIQLSTTAEEPINYFYLLRSLFRSIGGGRFELLYKDILPLLEMLLEVLNNLLNAASKPQERHLYVELCLTVPARLSNLLPHLSYLMRPLVVALGADSDLVGQGLRTLELCVDNLTADYLDPIMAPVIDDLMRALWDHLRPTPYNPFHSHTTMRILGKLGGRNRRFLIEPPALQFKQYADEVPSFDIRLIGSSRDRALQSNIGLDLAISKLRDVPKSPSMIKADPYYKDHAFRYIAAQIKVHIGIDTLPEGFPQLLRIYSTDLVNKKVDNAMDVMDRTDRGKSISKKNGQQEDLKRLLKACLFATTLPDLKETAQALLADVCTHFVILDIGLYLANAKHKMKSFDVKAGEGPICLDNRVLAEALVETLSSDSEDLQKTAELALQYVYDASKAIFGSEKADRLPFLSTVAKIFCHSCYQEEWYTKAGGALGISMLNNLILNDTWLAERQVEFVKALMFLIKDIPQDLPTRTRTQALETMESILKRCCKNAAKKDLENHQTRLYQLCLHIGVELSHMNKYVREAAQRALKVIASLMSVEVHEIMEPIKDRLLQPIYNKPLRALPFAIQIGYIEAVTYCLNLQNGIVQFSDQLNRLLLETLALTDADDETLASKPTEHRTAESIISLRVSCLRLLSTALFTPELSGQQQLQSRNRIISVFFRSLYSSKPDVIDAAYAGLKGVLDQTNRLPKDLLQNGLRPILMTLQDPKKVNLPTLDGLARLLNLLTNYFKPEIGDRLILHMETIAKDPALQKTSFALVEQVNQMKIVAASLNIFHLLPQQAVSQLPKIVALVLEFESKLRRTQGSLFREPVFKYLAKYPRESWEYFSTRLGDLDHGRLFAQILENPQCSTIREMVLTNINELLKRCFTDAENNANLAAINGIKVIHAICKADASWLKEKEAVRNQCLEAGRQLHAKQRKDELEPEYRLLAHQTEERLMGVLVHYLGQVPEDLDFLFKIVENVTNEELKMQPALKDFIFSKIIASDSPEYWRNMITHCMDLYCTRTTTPKMKTFIFRNIVNPIFAMDVKRGFNPDTNTTESRLLDRTLIDAIHNKIWKSQLIDAAEDQSSPGVDHARLELLQMSAMLLKYHHNHVADFRKDLIKFGWSYMKLEDTINKQAAYVVTGFFIAQFESPAKIVREIYFALLKAHQTESRILVTQALDLIAPVLSKRLAAPGDKDAKFPVWAKLPKRIITEESSNLQQLISIVHFIIRHPRLFYESREHFIPAVVPFLPKIAQPPNPSSDNKKLVLNVIELIRNWERRRISGGRDSSTSDSATNAGPMADSGLESSPAKQFATDRSDYMIPSGLRTALIKYLAQLISTLIERYPVPASKLKEYSLLTPQVSSPPNEVCRKAFSLFYDLLSPDYWADLSTDLFPRVTEQVLASDRTDRTDDKTVTGIVNTLQLVRVILNFKSAEWIQTNIASIQKLLEKPLKMDNPEVQDCLHTANLEMDSGREITPLLQKVLNAMPSESGEEDEMDLDSPPFEFIRFVSTVAGETLAANNLVASINILWTISLVRPKDIDQHIPLILRALQSKLAKDHVANAAASHQNAGQQNRQLDQSGAVQDAREAEIQTQLILKTIDIVAKRMSTLGEQRRPFLSVLASLVDKSFDNRVCEKILGMVEIWIFDWNEAFPTLKEKTAVLHKMLNFEARPDPHMLHKFLDLVIRIYEDPKITRTELTVRLEHAFLVGTRAQDVTVRNRFMTIFDRSLTRTGPSRLSYVLTSQNWDTLAETFWLCQALQLVLGSVDMNTPAQLHSDDFRLMAPSQLYASSDPRKNDVTVDDQLENMIAKHRKFCASVADVKVRDFLEPLCQLQHTDSDTAYKLWVAIFPLCWAVISREDRMELEKGTVNLLTKDYHQRQIDRRPNVVQALLEGAVRSTPRFKIPPHVLKFLSKTYGAWYTALVSLEETANEPLIDAPLVKESNLDALVETYAGLEEEDLFYGAWRRRCKFVETNSALSYEQNGVWDKAQRLYENAQVKARTAVLPFSQGEYMIWEDHWVLCAQKLQQWDVLYDFAKHMNFNDLLLEATYRNFDQWSGAESLEGINSIVKAVSDAPTPRRIFFQAFMALLKFYEKPDSHAEFNRICDEAIQLSIRKWHQLPKRITNAHIPILQGFQQLVELNDAQVIFQSLQATNATNLDSKSQELKLLLGSWRDRLPNVWDDINAWQSLVTWRQHIFTQINKTYLNLIQPGAPNNSGTSFAYRGYHETAWIINRFAHVARKHQLPEVCISQLSKIYTLPNIEIQEAFLKLREQAKCHYQNPSELNNGLDVINNTNLNYFGAQQKAEFYTLKGMFLAKLKHKDEANDAFGTALYYDIRLPKAWAEWGQYNDSKFRSEPDNIEPGHAAVSCYLEAASLFKNAKSRKLLSRVLWLLSVDTEEGKIAKAFEDFKGDAPVWYWITFIPQLLTSLSHREAHHSRTILTKIAKIFPQALYFQIRTNREDMIMIKKQTEQKMAQKQKQQGSTNAKPESTTPRPGSSGSRPNTANGDTTMTNGSTKEEEKPAANGNQVSPKDEEKKDVKPEESQTEDQLSKNKKPWEHSEDVMQALKTAFPLLALSMETMVDQMQKNFKCPPDEDAYRLIVALLNDGMAYIGRVPAAYAQDYKLPPATENNIRKFAETILPPHIRGSFEEDFVAKKPTMYEYIHKLRKWRDKFEEKLDHRPAHQSLEMISPHLSEFRFQKFDEVEIPGQYLLHRDKNQDFIRIERFLPDVDLVRIVGFSHRRLKIRGHDGSIHTFAVQHPAARHSRREERTIQLFRIFNGILAKKKETRRRKLNFFLPLIIPLAPATRLVQEDEEYISLQGIFEDHCRRHGLNKDEPMLFIMEKLRAMAEMRNHKFPDQVQTLKMEAFTAIQDKWVPKTIALEYFRSTYTNFDDFWLFRRQFAYQLAALTFMTYTMHMTTRYPQKMMIARGTGNIWGSELVPFMNQNCTFHNGEPVPFRLTPNLQTVMGPVATEGIYACSIQAIARSLTEPEGELEQQLSIFVRDEVMFWFTQQHRSGEGQLRERVQHNSEVIVNKTMALASPPQGPLPSTQTVIDIISKAVDPLRLAQCDPLWMAYL